MPASFKPCYCLLAALFVCLGGSAQNNYNLDFEDLDKTKGLPTGWGGKIIKLDSVVKQNGHHSLSLEKAPSDDDYSSSYYSIKSTFGGKKVTLTGYIKSESVEGGIAGMWLRVDADGKMLNIDNMENRAIKGTTDWKQYTVELPYNDEEATEVWFGTYITGKGKIWMDNFQLLVDGKPIQNASPKVKVMPKAKVDTAFATASGVNKITITRQTIDNLTNLGMLWGFIKYHHPAVAKGNYNMDAELFRVLPKVLAAPNKAAANAALETWVDGFGKPDVCKTCEAIKKDSATKIMPDYGYLFNKGNLNESLINKLTYIKNNRNQGKSYYVGMAPNVGNPQFNNENPYVSMDYPDAGFRLLTVYRYWNMIQYFFPYKHLIGEDWNKVLTEEIPVFASAKDSVTHHLACLKLIARVHDTHANLWGNNKYLNQYYGGYYAPVQTKFIENKLVVTGYYRDSADLAAKLKRGTIITKINNAKVEDLIKQWLPETAASNYETQLRDLPLKMLRGTTNKVTLEINQDGALQTLTLDRFEAKAMNRGIDYDPAPADSSYKLLPNNIGYIYPGKWKNKQLPAVKELFKNTKGIVVDMRCYPSDFMPFSFGTYIKKSNSQFAQFSEGSVATPGLFKMGAKVNNGGDSLAYNGKIVVIVNASTQSQAEYTTMAFQSSPNVTVIGSTTAAADGNVSAIYLPGNIYTMISGIGVYYPDGRETQRIGVKIDVPVKPTIKGIQDGRDELLEKAVAIIEGQ